MKDFMFYTPAFITLMKVKARRLHYGAFTRVPQVDQRGCINQSEPCKQFLSTEVINGVDG